MKIDRKEFYNSIKQKSLGLFPGSLTQDQVDGFEAILNEWESSNYTDIRWLAYLLATTYHETARTFKPLEEYGKGVGKEYGKKDPYTGKAYYGRGFVQLTWKQNYAEQGNKYGIDFVSYPEKVMEPSNAAKILIHGSADGDFTGKKLSDYFNATTNDPTNARRIINGTDKASLIAGYHQKFLGVLQSTQMAQDVHSSPELPDYQSPPETSPVVFSVDLRGYPDKGSALAHGTIELMRFLGYIL